MTRSCWQRAERQCYCTSDIPLLSLLDDKLNIVYRGEFAEELGEDFLGLSELGLSGLHIPHRLLYGPEAEVQPSPFRPAEIS